jgi:hypothetical protein
MAFKKEFRDLFYNKLLLAVGAYNGHPYMLVGSLKPLTAIGAGCLESHRGNFSITTHHTKQNKTLLAPPVGIDGKF